MRLYQSINQAEGRMAVTTDDPHEDPAYIAEKKEVAIAISGLPDTHRDALLAILHGKRRTFGYPSVSDLSRKSGESPKLIKKRGKNALRSLQSRFRTRE